jgi:Mce-associated membrane protein
MSTPDGPGTPEESNATVVEREAAKPEAAEPEVTEPEKAEPEKAEPEKAEPEKAEPSDALRSRRGRPATPVLVLSILLAVAVVAAATFGVLLIRRSAADRAGAEALATAQAYAVTVTTYDYQNLDRNFADVLDGAAGEFKDQYSGASRTLRQLISGAKTTSKGTVLAAGIRSQSTDQVEVLVFIDQVITNAVTPQPKIDRTRVVMTLTPHDGRWLVNKLELE